MIPQIAMISNRGCIDFGTCSRGLAGFLVIGIRKRTMAVALLGRAQLCKNAPALKTAVSVRAPRRGVGD